jgi:hypothetical protein
MLALVEVEIYRKEKSSPTIKIGNKEILIFTDMTFDKGIDYVILYDFNTFEELSIFDFVSKPKKAYLKVFIDNETNIYTIESFNILNK